MQAGEMYNIGTTSTSAVFGIRSIKSYSMSMVLVLEYFFHSNLVISIYMHTFFC